MFQVRTSLSSQLSQKSANVRYLFQFERFHLDAHGRQLLPDLDPRYMVYGVKSLSSIPLADYASAQTAVNAILARFKLPAQIPGHDASDLQGPAHNAPEDAARSKVKFSDTNDVRIVTPRAAEFSDASPPTSVVSSGSSTPVSDSDVRQALGESVGLSVSFWSRGSRATLGSVTNDDEEEPLARTVRTNCILMETTTGTSPRQLFKRSWIPRPPHLRLRANGNESSTGRF